MENKQREWSLDFLRIVSCYLVILVHTSVYGWYDYSPRTLNWAVLNFYDTLGRPSLPIFIMISGSLFLRKKHIDFRQLWLKSILHLGVIYVVWVLFYAVTNTGVQKSIADPAKVLELAFGPNPQFHLWYLRTLMNLYAIAPLLWVLVRAMDGRLVRYFLALFFVFGVLRKTVYELPFTPAWLHEQINLFMDMDLVEYSAYFMLGYILVQPEALNRFSAKTLIIVYVIALTAGAGLNHLIAYIDNWPTQALYNNFSIPVATEAVCLFLLFRKKFSAVSLSAAAGSWVRRLSESTLFVYLIHMFVIQRLQIYGHIYTTNYNVLFSVPLFSLLVFALAAAVGMLLERIPVLNRIL